MRLWAKITRQFTAPFLMERMFARFNVWVDADKTSELEAARELRGAAMRCMSCGHVKDCAAWLDSAEERTAPPDFCLNSELIARLRAEGETIH